VTVRRHRIREDQLQIQAPLPVDVYDVDNRLLLRRGNIIATEAQLERLIAEGLFSDQPLPRRPRAGDATTPAPSGADAAEDQALVDGPIARAAAKPKLRISIYAEVVAAARSLEALLYAPEANPGFADEIAQLADTLRKACALDPDAALAHIMFAREVRYPTRHAINVAIITALLLERTNNDPTRTQSAVCAALTGNLTIQAVQDSLYQQQATTPEQRQAMSAHPEEGARKLAVLGVRDETWLEIVRQHHEFVDGSGYPQKLTGAAVLREAQVIGLADRYCGTVTERAYRQAVAPDVAMTRIREKSGTAIDRALIAELLHWIGMYPPGTVVELVNREVAVVTRRLRDPQHPVVFAVCGQNLRPFESPRKRLTASQKQFHVEGVFPRETIAFPVDPEMLWPRTVTEEVAVA
jgi:HD-GYP domain-containing protein (c-di-GMP phosphodiesterase class II)